MEHKEAFQDIVRAAMHQTEAHAALAYGSRVWGQADEDSDLDLICLSANHRKTRELHRVSGIEVDIYCHSKAGLAKAIRFDVKTNNNFVLYGCARGVIMVDDHGDMERIARLAQKIWERGPVKPSFTEQRHIDYMLDKMLSAIASLSRKAAWGNNWHSISEFQCDQIFARLVNVYCRTNRLWASAIWEMLRWTESKYATIQNLCRRYLQAQDLIEKVNVIQSLAKESRRALEI